MQAVSCTSCLMSALEASLPLAGPVKQRSTFSQPPNIASLRDKLWNFLGMLLLWHCISQRQNLQFSCAFCSNIASLGRQQKRLCYFLCFCCMYSPPPYKLFQAKCARGQEEVALSFIKWQMPLLCKLGKLNISLTSYTSSCKFWSVLFIFGNEHLISVHVYKSSPTKFERKQKMICSSFRDQKRKTKNPERDRERQRGMEGGSPHLNIPQVFHLKVSSYISRDSYKRILILVIIQDRQVLGDDAKERISEIASRFSLDRARELCKSVQHACRKLVDKHSSFGIILCWELHRCISPPIVSHIRPGFANLHLAGHFWKPPRPPTKTQNKDNPIPCPFATTST